MPFVDAIFAFALLTAAVVSLTFGLVLAYVGLDAWAARHRERAVVREATRHLLRVSAGDLTMP